MKVEEIAQICHEANRTLCATQNDFTQLLWKNASDWQKKSAIKGVIFHLDNPDATPADSHESWMRQKELDGWKYGPVKDEEKKEHPCMVHYSDLPAAQQAKDYLFRGIVHALAPYVDVGERQAYWEVYKDE